MRDLNKKEMGNRIKQLRDKHGLTMENLCSITGLSKDCISKTESGKTEPRVSTILKIADALNSTPNYIMGVEHDTSFLDNMTTDALNKLKDFINSKN